MATTPAEEPAVAAGPRQLVTNQGKGFPLPADEHCRAASSEPTQQQAWDLGRGGAVPATRVGFHVSSRVLS